MKKISRRLFACLLFSAPLTALSGEPLATAPVQFREVAQTYSAEGVVEATRQSTVSAQISGRIKAIGFDIGDKVKAGQVILRIDEREADQALAGSEAQVSQSQASLQNAKLNYERAQQLFEQKFISQAALDKAQSDYQMAQAQAAASVASAKQSALTQAYTAVIAPYAGVVSARMVEMGEMVMVGKPLMTGFDPSQMRVIVNVPQYKLAEIGAHPSVKIEIPSLSKWLKAASVVVQPAADVRTHSTQVKITLPDNEPGLYPGMFVRAHFVVGKTKKLLIPSTAIVMRSEVVAAYVVDDKGLVSMRQIRVSGSAGENEVEVLSGLTAGEHVAIDAIKAGMSSKSK